MDSVRLLCIAVFMTAAAGEAGPLVGALPPLQVALASGVAGSHRLAASVLHAAVLG
jgi:hypothetical protein